MSNAGGARPGRDGVNQRAVRTGGRTAQSESRAGEDRPRGHLRVAGWLPGFGHGESGQFGHRPLTGGPGYQAVHHAPWLMVSAALHARRGLPQTARRRVRRVVRGVGARSLPLGAPAGGMPRAWHCPSAVTSTPRPVAPKNERASWLDTRPGGHSEGMSDTWHQFRARAVRAGPHVGRRLTDREYVGRTFSAPVPVPVALRGYVSSSGGGKL